MDDLTKQMLIEKNENIIGMVIERAKRDFPEDIAIIGLTGSFSTGDFHEKSDLDLIIINNTDRGWGMSRCFILGDVGYDFEETKEYRYLPENYESKYMGVIHAKTADEIRNASCRLLKSMMDLYHRMEKEFSEQPVPTFDNLRGTYEELWCNCRNKMIESAELNDKSYAFHAAIGAQNFLDEMTKAIGTRRFELMPYFDADHLYLFKDKFLQAMDEYLDEYNKVGRKVERYDSFEQLYDEYMKIQNV
ncbi:hypothetical protein J41TS12_13920 [Paenibacillus antibioticophila]|uniref:Polymerase nucleotidyl transferase domain-containing protein n=1 Tax=Paenibacillus antibioticophila TaxID=1274374 RepID=A0A919XNY1_9BACL|nr:nucleotidyltransferase domain-containing protein [Paenibacillus antibioticophila]GIO36531.1 hypothetical protein J41TS12_13920 [Paenibacillus antibioticophila]